MVKRFASVRERKFNVSITWPPFNTTLRAALKKTSRTISRTTSRTNAIPKLG